MENSFDPTIKSDTFIMLPLLSEDKESGNERGEGWLAFFNQKHDFKTKIVLTKILNKYYRERKQICLLSTLNGCCILVVHFKLNGLKIYCSTIAKQFSQSGIYVELNQLGTATKNNGNKIGFKTKRVFELFHWMVIVKNPRELKQCACSQYILIKLSYLRSLLCQLFVISCTVNCHVQPISCKGLCYDIVNVLLYAQLRP